MFENYPDVVSIENLMTMLHIGKSSAYSLLRQNKIPHVRVGRKYVIPKQSVIGFINNFGYNNEQIINGRLTTVKKGASNYDDRKPTN